MLKDAAVRDELGLGMMGDFVGLGWCLSGRGFGGSDKLQQVQHHCKCFDDGKIHHAFHSACTTSHTRSQLGEANLLGHAVLTPTTTNLLHTPSLMPRA
jgi:hypothetical protein